MGEGEDKSPADGQPGSSTCASALHGMHKLLAKQPPAAALYLTASATPEVLTLLHFVCCCPVVRFGNGLEMFEAQFKRHFRLPESCEYSAVQPPAIQSSRLAEEG